MVVEIPNAKWSGFTIEGKVNTVTFMVPRAFEIDLDSLFAKAAKCNLFVNLKLSLPRKPKTTGKESQNNHAWGHVRQMARHTGDDVEEMFFWVRVRAEKRGYPVKRDAFGNPNPKRWSEASTAEAVMVIDQCHEDAHFLGVELKEEDQ